MVRIKFPFLLIQYFCLDVCEEKKFIEDKLRSDFEFELKSKLDELYQILDKEYNEKILFYKNNQTSNGDYDRNSEQRLKELYQEIERSKVEHEKQINELNNELDRLRTNGEFYLLRIIYARKLVSTKLQKDICLINNP